MAQEKYTKCDCPADKQIGIEYYGMHPQHYDGISEFQCMSCSRRWGRWTGRELIARDDYEPRYGGKS